MPRFLIIQLARFGDLLQTARLAASLALRGDVHFCVDQTLVPLAKYLYPQSVIHGVLAHATEELSPNDVLIGMHKTLSDIATYSFDGVYNLNHSAMNRVLGSFFPPEIQHGYRMAYGQALQDTWIQLTFRLALERRITPLNLMDFWAHFIPDPIAGQLVNPKAQPGGRGIGVVLAGRHARRSISPELLSLCVSALFERLGGPQIFLFGTKAERPVGRALARLLPAHMQDNIHNYAGKTSYIELAEALTGLDALLTPDTGTMHLAAHLGVPVEALFLSSAWAHETGPYGQGHRVWQAAPSCAPCTEHAHCDAVPCLTAFEPRWLMRAMLAENLEGLPPPPKDVRVLETCFDDFGIVFHDMVHKETKDTQTRAQLRLALQTHVHAGSSLHPEHLAPQIVANLYQEADWMLPNSTS